MHGGASLIRVAVEEEFRAKYQVLTGLAAIFKVADRQKYLVTNIINDLLGSFWRGLSAPQRGPAEAWGPRRGQR